MTQLQRLTWWQYPPRSPQPSKVSKHLWFSRCLDIFTQRFYWVAIGHLGAGYTCRWLYTSILFLKKRVSTKVLWPGSYSTCKLMGNLSEKPFSTANDRHQHSWFCKSSFSQNGLRAPLEPWVVAGWLDKVPSRHCPGHSPPRRCHTAPPPPKAGIPPAPSGLRAAPSHWTAASGSRLGRGFGKWPGRWGQKKSKSSLDRVVGGEVHSFNSYLWRAKRTSSSSLSPLTSKWWHKPTYYHWVLDARGCRFPAPESLQKFMSTAPAMINTLFAYITSTQSSQ